MNSEIFLQKYRVLEGLLEKRYEGRKMSSSSVVIEYIRDDDSEPVRVDLDLLREIRNILSHNAGVNGAPVVQPSDEMISRLDAITEYVRRTRKASSFGTPAERIFSAHPNDSVYAVMRAMRKNGYSHVPVRERGAVTGVLSIRSIFDYISENGFESLHENSRIGMLSDYIRIDRNTGERYRFVAEDTSIISVRNAFRSLSEKNRRLSCVFVTRSGSPEEELICMLTPWDVLSNQPLTKENRNESGKHKD